MAKNAILLSLRGWWVLLKQEPDNIPRVVVLLFVGAFVAGGIIGYFNRGFSLFSGTSNQRSSPSSSQSVAPSQREPQSRPAPAPKPIVDPSVPSSPAAPTPSSPPAPVSPPPDASSLGAAKPAVGVPAAVFRVQVGAFRRRENAVILVQQLQRDGYRAYISHVAGLYRVRIGAFTNREDAEQLVEALRAKNYDVFVAR